MEIIVKRLKRGDDLMRCIKELCRENNVFAGVVLSGVGCVTRARIRDASGVTVREIEEDMEIVSLTGTVSVERSHLHIAFSKRDLSTVGGHLLEGTLINTTCELAVMKLDDVAFSEEFDNETGYGELKVRRETNQT